MQKKLWMRRLAAWLSRGSATVAASPARRTPARRQPRALLALEMLEDRNLLSAGSLDPLFNGTGFNTAGFNLGGTNNDQGAGSAIQPDGKVIVAGSAEGTQNIVKMTNFSSKSVGSFPTGGAAGDFNGDLKADMATANYGGNSVSVLLGNGNGTFGNASTLALAANTQPFAIKSGVFNEATNFLDIVTGDFNGQSVTYIAGNGNGTFKTPVKINVGHKIVAIAVGDLNGDNHLDIAASSGDGTITVILGNGNGALTPLPAFSALTPIFDIAIGSFNTGSGSRPGLVVAAFAANKVGVLTGNNDGTFAAPVFTNTNGSINEFLAVGDFNGDTKTDVATTNLGSDNTSVLLGNGNGTFSSTATVPAGLRPLGITLSDINRDNRLDLVVANQGTTSANGSVTVSLGNGNGTFAAPVGYNSGVFPFAVVAHNFNLTEGAPDVVAINFDGLPNAAITLATNNSAVGTADFALARFNVDGTLDTTFGLGGRVHVGFNLGGTNEDRAFSVGIDPSGKIVVAGYAQVSNADFQMAVARLNANGTMDPTFGSSGKTTIGFNLNPNGSNIALATSTTLLVQDNGIIVGGQAQITGTSELNGDFHFALAKLTNSGFLDPTFSSGPGPAGTVVYPSLGLSGTARENDGVDGIARQQDGKIIFSGFAGGPNSRTNFIAAGRVNANGTIDTTFSPSGPIPGVFAINLNLNLTPGGDNNNQGTGIALASDGKAVISGFAQTSNAVPNVSTGSYAFVVLRLNLNGTLDNTFNFSGTNPGVVAFGFNLNPGGQNDDEANAVAIQVNGSIVVSGFAQSGPGVNDYHFAVARLTPNGTLDSTFGIVGVTGNSPGVTHFTTGVGSENVGLSMVLDNRQTISPTGVGDGFSNIIVSGFTSSTTGNDFAIGKVLAMQVLPIAGDWTGKGFESPGIYDPRTSTFYLRNSNSTGDADIVANIQSILPGTPTSTNPAGFGWTPLVGRWTPTATADGLGLYDPAGSTFFLWNNITNPLSSTPDFVITFGPGNSGYKPVTGRFLAGGTHDSIGVWDPQSDRNATSNSTFLLKETLASPNVITVNFGPANNGVNPATRTLPLMGDWTNKGFDSVGVWQPSISQWSLRNSNTSGVADITFTFGPANGGGVITNAVTGAWTAGATIDGVGVVNPIASPKMTWSLKNTPSAGPADITFTFADPLGGSPQLARGDSDAIVQGLTEEELSGIVGNALLRFSWLGLSQDQWDLLLDTNVVIAALPDGEVGFTNGNDGTIYIDPTAGGLGWFVDRTADQDEEFQDGTALAGSEASGKMDLLTVVLHEFGHKLGLVDLDPSVYGNDLMSATLSAGTRRGDVLDALYAQGYLQ